MDRCVVRELVFVLLPLIALIDNNECVGHEAEVKGYVETLQEQWEGLLEKIDEKTQKLREANQQQQFNEAAKDLDFWLSGVSRDKIIL